MAIFEKEFRRIGVPNANFDYLTLAVDTDEGTIKVRHFRTSDYGRTVEMDEMSLGMFRSTAHWKDKQLLDGVTKGIGHYLTMNRPDRAINLLALKG